MKKITIKSLNYGAIIVAINKLLLAHGLKIRYKVIDDFDGVVFWVQKLK